MHWMLVALVATAAWNVGARPRDKELEPSSNRYEKRQEEVTYERIDIPYGAPVKNDSNTVLEFVPVPLWVKNPNVKIWPSDQNGIETPEDLSLYNLYTNNIRPGGWWKPSVPEVGSMGDSTQVHTRPIQVLDRPSVGVHRPLPEISAGVVNRPKPEIGTGVVHQSLSGTPFGVVHRPLPEINGGVVHQPYPEIGAGGVHQSYLDIGSGVVHRPLTESPVGVMHQSYPEIGPQVVHQPLQEIGGGIVHQSYPEVNTGVMHQQLPEIGVVHKPSPEIGAGEVHQPSPEIVTQVLHQPTPTQPLWPTYETSTHPETTTKKQKVHKCPTVFITTSVGHQKGKEGCQDINIHITTHVNNSIRPNRPPSTQSDVATTQPGFIDTLVSFFSRISSFFYGGHMFSGLFTAFSTFLLPWLFPHLMFERRSVVVDERLGVESTPPPEVKKFDIESIATVARASSDGAPSPPIKEMIDTVSQLVESDIRTPPKLKEIIKANEQKKDAGDNSTPLPYTFIYDDDGDGGKFEQTEKSLQTDSSEGKASNVKTDEGIKGIAIPVVMDEDYEVTTKKLQKLPEMKPLKDEKKKGATKPQVTTTPSSGLSTWILLSDNKDVTTPASKKTNGKKEDEKKKGVTTTTKKPTKITATTTSSKKPTSKPLNKNTEMSALEAMVKNKKGSTTTMKPKVDTKKKNPDGETKGEVDVSETKTTTYTLPPRLPITTSSSQSSTDPTSESSTETTTKKKSTKKKKKNNKNKRKKPEETAMEAKVPPQPVGSQIYNFLSREIVPTVGLGLIGVALTAGLASFLGYNPFATSTVPLRRTYDTHHGYTPNNYYNYNTDYGDGGQSEEVLFREVLSGMPEDSRYGLTHTDYNRQEQPVYYNQDKDANYDTNYPQDYYGNYDSQDKKDNYPVYRETGTSFVYPETTHDYSNETTKTNPDTIERQPEALYRVASDTDVEYRNTDATVQGSSQNSWRRIGSPMDTKQYPAVEPGPRSLDLEKVKKRTKRSSVIQRISRKRTKKQNDVENEIDFDDSFHDENLTDQKFTTVSTTTESIKTTLTPDTTTLSTTTTTEDVKEIPTETYATDNDTQPQSGVSVLDVLKRLAQFKLRLGLNFLRSTTDLFSRYLDDIQKRVDESFANSTTTTVQYNRKSPWSRIFFSRQYDERRKRSLLDEDRFSGVMLTEGGSRLSKSAKKDLRNSNKIFHEKRNTPKKYKSKRTK